MISIIITTHQEARDLPGILNSIENQREYGVGKHSKTGHDFKYAAGGLLDYAREVIVTCDGDYGGRADILDLVKTLLQNPKEGAPGHHTRQPGIEAATGDFTVLTNSDNYFCSGWLSSIQPHLVNKHVGLIYWDLVSNLWGWTTQGGSKLKRGGIDLSAVAVRSEIAKKIGFPFRSYEGDYDYIQKCGELCSRKGLKIVKIDEILSVHN